MSNNKQSMKLYTEEEIRKRLNSPMDDEVTIDEFIESLTPIELPSDEEIEKGVKNEYPLTGHVGIDHRNHLRKVGYIQGAKMVINKIQGGNNEQQ